MINVNYGLLAGIFNAGFHLHAAAIPIMQTAARPDKNKRDLFLAYTCVLTTYFFLAIFGYIGFVGTPYREYF